MSNSEAGSSVHSSLARWRAQKEAAAAQDTSGASPSQGRRPSPSATGGHATRFVEDDEVNRDGSQVSASLSFSNRPSSVAVSPSRGHDDRPEHPSHLHTNEPAGREAHFPPPRASAPAAERYHREHPQRYQTGDASVPSEPSGRSPSATSSGARSARRPPVDAEVIGSQWEARYKEEKTPQAPGTNRSRTLDPGVSSNEAPRGRTRPLPDPEEDAPDDTTDLVAAFRAKEREALEARKALLEAEAHHKRETEALQKLLAHETTARQRAEQDVEELLSAHAQVSPSLTPTSTHLQRSQSGGGGGGGGAAPSDVTRVSTISGIHATAASDAFWKKMKEREERARAKVRKEFIQQSQQKLYAEQDKRAEAEKLAKEAERRLRSAEDRANAQAEAAKELRSTIEALKGTISEREVSISELQSEVALLTRQLELRHEDKEKEKIALAKKCADLQEVVQARDQALEEQRSFTQQLLQELGLKEKDLLDRESINAGVKREIQHLQEKYQAEQDAIVMQYKDREAALKQELEHNQATMHGLKEKCEDYKARISGLEGELARQQGSVSMQVRELEAQKERIQGQLIDLGVEKRSLELQLERVSEAAGRYAKDYASTKEGERQNREVLIRRYTAEIATLQEEVDRLALQRKRDQERSLQEILQLGQELTALKEQNTRYEHALNLLEHDRSHATKLLSQARENNQLLLQDKMRSQSNTPAVSSLPRTGTSLGRISIVHDVQSSSTLGASAWPADDRDVRIAELERVRVDLREKLSQANTHIDYLEQQLASVRRAGPPRGSAGPTSASAAAIVERDHVRQETDALKEKQRALAHEVRFLQQRREALQDAIRHAGSAAMETVSSSPSPSVAAIYAALVNMVRLLEGNISVNRQRSGSRDTVEDAFYFKHLERDALEQVLSSCLAALDCLQGKRSGSPYFSEGESSFSKGSAVRNAAAEAYAERDDGRLSSQPRQRPSSAFQASMSPPPPLPGAASIPSRTDALGRNAAANRFADPDRTELESEPCWEEDSSDGEQPHQQHQGEEEGDNHEKYTSSRPESGSSQGGDGKGDEDDEVFVPHTAPSGILRYSPISHALPESSLVSPSPHGKRQPPISEALFDNVRTVTRPSAPASEVQQPPGRSTPPPPQQLRKRQTM